MKSDLPKVLHRVGNRPMISHLLDALSAISSERTVVVVAPGMTQLFDAVAPADTAVQTEALGTGHAVLAARDQMQDFTGDVLVLFGDTPLLTAETMQDMLTARRAAENPAVVVLGFRPDDPAEYGRLVTAADGGLEAIVEFKDASDAQREIGLCNAGIMAIDGNHLFALLDAVGNDNANGEYYLTDIVELARDRGLRCAVVEAADPVEVMGVNSRAQLAEAEAAMQARLRDRAMAGGVRGQRELHLRVGRGHGAARVQVQGERDGEDNGDGVRQPPAAAGDGLPRRGAARVELQQRRLHQGDGQPFLRGDHGHRVRPRRPP